MITKLDDLTLDPQNANAGTVRGTQLLDASLESYGAGRGVVCDQHGVVIAGNKTVELAVAQGLTARIVPSDGTTLVVVQRTDLDLAEPRARELAYLDNRTAEVGLAWDPEQLAADVVAGLDFGAMFTPEELSALTDPVLKFLLEFDTQAQRAQWDTLVARLASRYPDATGPVAALDAWVRDALEAMNAKSSTSVAGQ